MIQTSYRTTPSVATPLRAQLAPPPTFSGDGVTLGETMKSMGACGLVMAAPSMLGAAYGLGGAAIGLGAVGLFAKVATGGDANIMVPFSLTVGAVAAAGGLLGGWPGAVVATGVGLAYGFACR